MKIFILSSRFPYPIERGDKLRLYHQIKGLSVNHELYLYSLTDETISIDDEEELKQYCKQIKVFNLSKSRRWLELAKSFLNKLPFQVALNYNAKIKKQIIQEANIHKPDLVYCQLIRMAPYATSLEAPKVIDYMDAYGVGMERRATISNFVLKLIYQIESKRTKAYEKAIYHNFDKHTIISDQDAALIDTAVIETIPNGLDAEFFKPQETTKKYDIGFIGNMGYLPNVEAAEIICNKILPKLKTKVNVLIAGARPHERVLSLKSNNVDISGWVEDIRTAYDSCRILVAPLYNGTGQQNKILEAMAMGVPCITTSVVNEAIGAVPNKEIMIADTDQGFANIIEQLLNDQQLCETLKTTSRAFIVNEFTWNKTNKKLNAIFAAAIATKLDVKS